MAKMRRNKTHKKMRRNKTNKRIHKSKKHYKSSKSFVKTVGRGSEKETTHCCMCDKSVSNKDSLVPLACLRQHGSKAHRICQPCWWDPETGFALETSKHDCPGCKRGLPLTTVKPNPHTKTNKSPEEVIVISS